MQRGQPFLPNHSVADPPHVCGNFSWKEFHFQTYRNSFCLPLTLVNLTLWNIPHPGYLSPVAAVTCLSALTSLEELHLNVRLHYPDQEILCPRPLTRAVLLSLTTFSFQGVSEYLEDFVARIDAPQLSHLKIGFVQAVFETSQLAHFINHTPCLKATEEAHVAFYGLTVFVTLSSSPPTPGSEEEPDVEISCEGPNGRVSSLAQVCSSFSPSLSTVENLYIYHHQYSEPKWQDDEMENAHWLELLRPFTIVKSLYICELFSPHLAPTLQVLGEESMTEVLPVLQNVFVEGLQPSGPVQDSIFQFVAARQLSGRPIAISGWVRT
jgi:hypothetical protein